MHLGLKVSKNIFVVVVGMCEEPVQSPYNIKQMFSRTCWNRYSRVEVTAILLDRSAVINRVNHVVNCRAFFCLFVGRTHKQPSLIRRHLWT